MLITHECGLTYHDSNYHYCNDYNFMFEKISYEKDEDNGRCYRLEESTCLRPDCDGKLVRRRIPQADYEQILKKLKSMIPKEEKLATM